MSEVVSSDPATGRAKVRVLVNDIPATGYKTDSIASGESQTDGCNARNVGQGRALGKTTLACDRHISGKRLPPTGKSTPRPAASPASIDKRSNTEALAPAVPGVGAPPNLPDGKPCGNLLQAFVDKPKQWDAWNVDADFIEHHTDLLQGRRSEADREHAVACGDSRQAHLAKLQFHSGHHSERRPRPASMSTCRPTGTRSTSC